MSEQNSPHLSQSYWKLFSSSTISNLGDGMVVAAGPLLALSLTNDARLISAVTFAAMLPWLILSLPAGVYLDRYDRQKIMSRANLMRGFVFAWRNCEFFEYLYIDCRKCHCWGL